MRTFFNQFLNNHYINYILVPKNAVTKQPISGHLISIPMRQWDRNKLIRVENSDFYLTSFSLNILLTKRPVRHLQLGLCQTNESLQAQHPDHKHLGRSSRSNRGRPDPIRARASSPPDAEVPRPLPPHLARLRSYRQVTWTARVVPRPERHLYTKQFLQRALLHLAQSTEADFPAHGQQVREQFLRLFKRRLTWCLALNNLLPAQCDQVEHASASWWPLSRHLRLVPRHIRNPRQGHAQVLQRRGKQLHSSNIGMGHHQLHVRDLLELHEEPSEPRQL